MEVPLAVPDSIKEEYAKRSPTPKRSPLDAEVVGEYAVGRILGIGTFGTVKLGTHKVSGQKVRSCEDPPYSGVFRWLSNL
jgi:hypothetical protein